MPVGPRGRPGARRCQRLRSSNLERSSMRRTRAMSTARSKPSKPVAPTQQGFETLALHAGQDVDPVTKSRAVPIYQTTLCVRKPRACGQSVRAPGVRQYLHADHESDHRRAREARRGPRGRSRRACHLVRSSGANLAILNVANSGDEIVSTTTTAARTTSSSTPCRRWGSRSISASRRRRGT